MCFGSVCAQPPYLFFYLIKSFPLSHIKPFSDACLCDVTQTQALPWLLIGTSILP